MPNFLRECVAREGQDTALRDQLVAAHERFARAIPHLVEVLLYREHFIGRRFLSIVRYDDERAVASLERGEMLDAGQAIDIDRYLASSLRRQHMDALAPYLSAPPQWYALDPVWRYVRRP